jgi:uncharacterized RmlC-like cupin family protein
MSTPSTEPVRLIEPGGSYEGKQGLTYGSGASRETVGAQHICMNVLPMAPGAKAKAHYHEGIETIAYLLEGECVVYYGQRLEHHVTARAGDHTFVPADVPHAPSNESGAPCKWLVVHSSGSDQDGIVLLPELDLILAAK